MENKEKRKPGRPKGSKNKNQNNEAIKSLKQIRSTINYHINRLTKENDKQD
jgi:hypothetical protein